MTLSNFKNLKFRRISLLRIVQLITAIPVNIFLFIILDNSDGIFGKNDALPFSGLLAVLGFIVLSVVASVLIKKMMTSGFGYGGFAFALAGCLFVTGIKSDLIVSLIGIAFNFFLAYKIFTDIKKYSDESGSFDGLNDNLFGAWSSILLWINSVAFAVCFLEAGYRISMSNIGIISVSFIIFGSLIISVYKEWQKNRPSLKNGPYLEWLLLILIIFLVIYCRNPLIIIAVAALRQLIVFFRIFGKTEYADRFSKYFFKRPAQLLALSFIAVISIGTVILSFPYVSVTGQSISLIDAFFTSTSATCVTGLIVLDTPVDFSLFGQVVILTLIQIGGLGIMTISTFAAVIIGRSVGLGQEYSLTKMIGENRVNRVYQLIKFICLFTFVIEIVGAVTLFPQFRALGFPFKTAIWKSVFHSISGFCNAGFSLQSDSLIPFQSNPGIIMTISALVIFGGLGFGVLYWFFERIAGTHRKNSFHVKIVLWLTGILLFAAALFVFIFEYNGALSGFSLADKIYNSIFAGMTPRTAGFNTFDICSLKPVTRFFTSVLMFIGVAPGSTGGGIKITTVFVLILTVRALIRGDKEIQGYGYSVSMGTVFRAAAVLLLGVATFVIGFALLLGSQNISFEVLGFEAMSAFGTVGLSMGATNLLDDFGKIILVILMFIGRVGPLTLVLSMQPLRKQEIYFPKANVMVG